MAKYKQKVGHFKAAEKNDLNNVYVTGCYNKPEKIHALEIRW